MNKHIIHETASGEPEHILKPIKPCVIAGNPPWPQNRGGSYGAVRHYGLLPKNLMGGQAK